MSSQLLGVDIGVEIICFRVLYCGITGVDECDAGVLIQRYKCRSRRCVIQVLGVLIILTPFPKP
jgi:hypothetical protein